MIPSPTHLARRIFQTPKKFSSGFGEIDRDESKGDSSAQSDEMKESCGMLTTDLQSGETHRGYALVPDG